MQALSKLKLIAEKARRSKQLMFTALVHHINVEMLIECHKMLNKDAACGEDGVTVEAYGEDLMANLEDLVGRLKSKTYKPKPVLRVYIPKPGKKELRPLGIPCTEDKLVQMAVKLILEAIFESNFLDNSHGFRPKKGCHTAIIQLNQAVMKNPTNYIVEVDIEKFFDSVSHYRLLQCLEMRIQDPNFLWLVRKLLKAGVMESGVWSASDMGTPQGGIVSPILANIYLHYTLDVWFQQEIEPKAKGKMQLIRYCDDFVATCESEHDAYGFLEKLKKRLAIVGLKISQEKTKVIKFGRQAWKHAQCTEGKVESFDFLGFTHYCATSKRGWFSMKSKTSKKSLARAIKAMAKWLKDIRSIVPLRQWWIGLKSKLNGHYAYYAVNGNMLWLLKYHRKVLRMAFKWINRRSQKKSMSWKMFMNYLGWNPLPAPRILHQIWYPILNK